MSSIRGDADSVTGLDLLMDAAGYGAVTGLAQIVSHKVFARTQLPKTWGELFTRYVAGSAIVAAGVSAWSVRRRHRASPTDTAALLWLTLCANGIVVGLLHHFDHQLAEAARAEGERQGADALRRKFEDEEHGRTTAAADVRRSLGDRG